MVKYEAILHFAFHHCKFSVSLGGFPWWLSLVAFLGGFSWRFLLTTGLVPLLPLEGFVLRSRLEEWRWWRSLWEGHHLVCLRIYIPPAPVISMAQNRVWISDQNATPLSKIILRENFEIDPVERKVVGSEISVGQMDSFLFRFLNRSLLYINLQLLLP